MADLKWSVEVCVDGELLVLISDDTVTGRENMSAEELDTIRECAKQLSCFAGEQAVTPFI